MRRLARLAILLTVFLAVAPHPTRAAGPTLTISVQSVSYVATGSSDAILADLRIAYSGPDILSFKPDTLALVDADGAIRHPSTYLGNGAMSSSDLDGTGGIVTGTVLFRLPSTVASGLAIEYIATDQAADGTTRSYALGRVALSLPPAPNATLTYGTAAQPALGRYVADEAVIAGYALEHAEESSSTPSTTFVQGYRATLSRDRAAFNALSASTPDAVRAKQQVDATMAKIDADLMHADARGWTSAAFLAHSRTLATLYQTWPGVGD